MLKKGILFSIIFVLVLVFSVIILNPSQGIWQQEEVPKSNLDEQGQVLGVSEENTEVVKRGQSPAIDFPMLEPEFDDFLPLATEKTPRKKVGAEKLRIKGGSAVVLDIKSNDILYSQNMDTKRSIASVTKLVTAMVFLESGISLEEKYTIKQEDFVKGGRIYLYPGETVSKKDLLWTSLVASANTAAMAMAGASGMTEEEFVSQMNIKSREMGLEKTSFVDPIGISYLNKSTAKEVLSIVKTAFANKIIKEASLTKAYTFVTEEGKSKTVHSTNRLLNSCLDTEVRIIGGKTGFTGAAGYCFVGLWSNKDGHELATVVLGSPEHKTRFSDTLKMVNWVYKNYEW